MNAEPPGRLGRAAAAMRRLRASELGGLGSDSFFVALWQGAVSAADLVQLALVTHALGLDEFGRLALVLGFVTLVSQFFDVRLGAAVTTIGARKLEQSVAAAAGVFQLSYLIDLATGIVGLAVVVALAPFVGPGLVGDTGTALIVLYGITLLASTLDESSISVLRLLDRFRLLATYNVALEACRIGLVAAALAIWGTLGAVLGALLVYKFLAGIANLLAAAVVFRRAGGGSLARPALATAREERPEMLRMVLHTNLVSYARIAQVQLPTILIGAIASATQVGLYKVGTAAAAAVGRITDPAYAALLPRISRLWAAGRQLEVRRLVARATLVSVPLVSVTLLALVVFREPVLDLLGGGSVGSDGETVLVLAATAQAVNGGLFWNIGVVFVSGGSRTVSHIAVACTVVQLAALPPLISTFDAPGAAASLLLTTIATNALLTYHALRAFGAPRAEADASIELAATAARPSGTE